MRIELRRHSLKNATGNALSPEGIELAKRIGREQLRGVGYTHVAASSYFRTVQTICAFAEGAGDFGCSEIMILDALGTNRVWDWQGYFAMYDVVINPDEPLVIQESERMAVNLVEAAKELPTDARLLCVGHTPLIECLTLGLVHEVVRPFRECEGVDIALEIANEPGLRQATNISWEEIRL